MLSVCVFRIKYVFFLNMAVVCAKFVRTLPDFSAIYSIKEPNQIRDSPC